MIFNLHKQLIGPLKELYYIFSYPITSKFISTEISTSSLHTKGTIVIVESWFQENAYHKYWVSYLENKGFRTYLLTYTNMNEDFPTSAKKLEIFIKKHNLHDFVLVGISTGALVCLYYLNNYNGWKRIKKFMSVGGPLRGTPTALFFAFTRKGRDLIPYSAFLQKLLRKPIPTKKMITLSAVRDEFIPRKSSVLPDVPSYIVSVYGHNFFHLDNKDTYDLIAELAT